jgi:hypothetical protein
MNAGTGRPPRWAVALPLALAVLVQLAASHRVGFWTGDDVEVLESALVPAGLPYQPWAIRNLLFPRLLVAPVLRLAQALGAADNLDLARIAVWPFIALTLANGLLVHRLAARLCDRRVAAVAAGVFALHWLPLVYGGTVYPRTASTTCILLAALLIAGAGRDLARGAGAGALVALGFADRYSEAIFLAPLGLQVLAARGAGMSRPRRAAGLAAGFALGAALTVGLSDLAFWGRPFASLVAFARWTLVETSERPGVAFQPALWYVQDLFVWLPPTLLPFLAAACRRPGLRLAWLGFTLPVAALSAIHHKELRYLQGTVPFLAILVAAGVVHLWDSGRSERAPAPRQPRSPGAPALAAMRPVPPAQAVAVAILLAASLLLSLRTARTVLNERSTAAVDAALALRRGPPVRRVALSLAWAFGDHLFFGREVTVDSLAAPPIPKQARAALETADVIGCFAGDLPRTPLFAAAIRRAPAASVQSFGAWDGKGAVVLLRRRAPGPPVALLGRPAPGPPEGGPGRP